MLAAEDLSFGYGARVIGRAVSLSLAPGQILALLGPNGGGKTTLLKTLLGLLPPLRGVVRFADRPLHALSARERAQQLAYVPQSAATPFAFTARDIVLMGRTAHQGLFQAPSREDRAIAAAALERLGVGHLGDRPITEISGGERQLVLVARALAQTPRAIILDEPTASLDFGNQGKVLGCLKSLAAEGLAILFTTHDPNQAEAYADTVVLLRDGGVRAEGSPRTVLAVESLAALYQAPVGVVADASGRRAFLPE